MDALLNYVEFVVQALISLLIWVVIIYVVLSWLISFDAINMRNRIVYRIAHLLELDGDAVAAAVSKDPAKHGRVGLLAHSVRGPRRRRPAFPHSGAVRLAARPRGRRSKLTSILGGRNVATG